MAVIRTRALILLHATAREHDRFLSVLTPTMGKQRLRARGTKKSVSKLGGSLQPLMEVDLQLANGRAIDVVTGSVIIQRWPELRSDLVGLVSAQWLLELIDRVTKPNQPERGLYPLAIKMLSDMTVEINWSLGRRWLALCRRGWQVLPQEGFTPNLEHCGLCRKNLTASGINYDPLHGFVHRAEAAAGSLAIQADTWRFITGTEPPPTPALLRQVRQLLQRLLNHVLERPLRSEKVLIAAFRHSQLSAAASRAKITPDG